MRTVLLSLMTVAGLSACSSAGATPPGGGYWAFDPARCPDLVEDRRDRIESRIDEAYDKGPRDVYEDYIDRMESKKDEARTYCPASAWVWRGPAYRKAYHPPRPRAVTVYYSPKSRNYFRYGKDKKRIVVIKL